MRQTSMPAVGFEPAVPASERPQSHPLDRKATNATNADAANFENGYPKTK
jgi:hypothetical protein